MRCPNCDNTNPPGTTECEYCGHELVAPARKRRTALEREPGPPPDAGKRRTVFETPARPRPGSPPRAPAHEAPPPAPQRPPAPGKRRTAYESPQRAAPSPRAEGTYLDDPFAAPPPKRPVYDPSDPFKRAVDPGASSAAGRARPKGATRFDAPAAEQGPAAVLVAFTGPDAPGRVHVLARGRNTLGRGDDQDVVLDDGRVSSQHAFLFVDADGMRFIDVSTNGSVVAGRPVLGEQVDLASGDLLILGHTRVVVTRLAPLPDDAWSDP